jgi:uncharacterized damage-inducible protein DinB
MNQIDKRKEYGEKRAIWLRNYQRARSRALARLGQENPERYQELLEEERAKDEAEGKAWLDLSGRTRTTNDSSNSPNRTGKVPVRQTNSDRI